MESDKKIIIGRQNPDTDSICSAIGYAGVESEYEYQQFVARRAGEINGETEFTRRFGGSS